jgi:Fe-S cluster assembly ATP-binding protein
VTGGEVWFKRENLLEKEPEERAHLGLFMSFQYPLEIAGVSNEHFLFSALNAQRKAKNLEPLSKEAFTERLDAMMKQMHISPSFKERGINEGFSGGEKKKNEILQMALLNPDFAILDETDSGLDIDAMRIVAHGVNQTRRSDNALLIITHYQRLLEYIQPQFIHVMQEGVIVRSGSFELAQELEEKGYGACIS